MFFGSSSGSAAPPPQPQQNGSYTTLPPGGVPIMVTKGTVDGQPIVSPRGGPSGGAARDLYVQGQDSVPGKNMQKVGQGGGDYVQVTTFRYVGKGAGTFNVTNVEEQRDDEDGGCACWQICCIFLCVVACLAGILWVVLPVDGSSLMDQPFLSKDTNRGLVTTTLTTTTSRGFGGVDISMLVGEVDFKKVSDSEPLSQAFEAAVKEALTFYIGHGLPIQRIGVTMLPSKGVVHADVVPPCGADVEKLQEGFNFTSLARAVVANLNTVGNIQASPGVPVTIRITNSESFPAECGPQEATQALVDRKEERERERDAEAAEKKKEADIEHCKVLSLSGGDGPSADQVNGQYLLQDVLFNDRKLFQKEGTPAVWLAFMKGRWYVTDTQRKNDNSGGGWLYSVESKGETPEDVEAWEEWDGKAWQQKDDIKAVCHKEDVTLPWSLHAAHSGCQNWRQIKLGDYTNETDVSACGKRCQDTEGCVGFNFFDADICQDPHVKLQGKESKCSLWNSSCTLEQNSCWMDYAMAQ